tara:strand:- start:3075 stop:3302 length:228 start_codon:yes stop_codon:yes gene_type:complete
MKKKERVIEFILLFVLLLLVGKGVLTGVLVGVFFSVVKRVVNIFAEPEKRFASPFESVGLGALAGALSSIINFIL